MTNTARRWAIALIAILMVGAMLAGCAWMRDGEGGSEPPQEPPANEAPGPPDGSTESPSDQPEDASPEAPGDPIRERMNGMSLNDKIGQLVMVGIEGTQVGEDTVDWFVEGRIGGVILYGDNIETVTQTIKLANGLKEASGKAGIASPLLIAADQEGGRVSRLPQGVASFPASRTVGGTQDPRYAEQIGEALGTAMASLGMNMDFAPVLDVDTNPDNPVIGDRAFGTTRDDVIRMGIPVMEGIQAAEVIPVVKHFPGHGDTSVDSHLGLPVVAHDIERLRRIELAPFAAAIEQGADAVMVAHLLMSDVDPEVPASMSRVVIEELLREQLKFDGVVITDDMTMGAIADNYSIGDAAVGALQAGADIVLIGHEPELQRKALQAIRDAAQSGELSADEIDRHVYRVLRLKEKYGLSDEPVNELTAEELNEAIRRIMEP